MDQLTFQQATSLSDIKACHLIRKKVFCEEQSISKDIEFDNFCLLYTSPSPRDRNVSRMPSSA